MIGGFHISAAMLDAFFVIKQPPNKPSRELFAENTE